MKTLKDYIPYLSFWLLNSAIFLIASFIFPRNIELGTATIPEGLSFLWAGAWLTLVVWFAKPLLERYVIKLNGAMMNFFFFLAINVGSIWVLARFAEVTGLGISSYIWAIFLGLIFNFLQWVLWQTLEKNKLVENA